MSSATTIGGVKTRSSGLADDLPPKTDGPVPSLEPTAMVALEAGRLLMQSGANAKSVQQIMEAVALGLGANSVELQISYASLAITVCVGETRITRTHKVGQIGVNHRLDERLWNLARRVSARGLTAEQAQGELARLATETPQHDWRVTALAVGLACGAFGRLLGLDWFGLFPVFLAATIGQSIRGALLRRGVNLFLCTTLVALVGSVAAVVAAGLAGSQTVAVATIASVLMLVPGIPAVNSQSEILEGRPTLGSARAVTVIMTLVFIAVGLWIGHGLLHTKMTVSPPWAVKTSLAFIVHQTAFGAIAAAGFGVLFNVGFSQLPWCAVSGALALVLRTGCQQLGFSLEEASFFAALAVGIAAQLRWRRTELSRDVLGLVGCMPMVPGSLAERALLALFALTATNGVNDPQAAITSLQYLLAAVFTTGAIGTGLAIPALLTRGARIQHTAPKG